MKTLERSLGLPSVVAISISAMLGSGIFVLPGLAAAKTGPSVWLAYALAGLVVLPAALSKAELATAMPASGGSYVYLDRIFGPFFGTVAGIALWASMWLKAAFALLGFGAYLAVLAPAAGASALVKTVALGLLALVVILNVLGVKKVGKAQVAVVAVGLCGLAGLAIAAGVTRFDASRLEPSLTHGVSGLFAAAGFVFVSYNGVTKVAAIAEEIERPERNLPLGILLSLASVTLIYAAVAFVLAGTIPLASLERDLHPIYTLATVTAGAGSWVAVGAAVLGVATLTSMANAGLLAASRFPFAMSRDNLLPPLLARVHARFRTPVASIVMTGVVMAIAISLLDVDKLAKLASAIVILVFLAEQTALIGFRESRVQWYKPGFCAPLYPVLPALGILSGAVLLVLLGALVPLAVAAVLAPGSLLYFLYGRRRARRLGVVEKISQRGDLIGGGDEEGDAATGVEASVVVALFGTEPSAEMLVEMGVALARGRPVLAIHFNEVEEHAQPADPLRDDELVRSLERRIGAMAEERRLDLSFRALSSRDLVQSVHTATRRAQADWLVMKWHERPRRSLTSLTPIGWLINNLEVNVAMFRDDGVRHVRKILALPEPGPHDALVARTADDLAAMWRAELSLVRFAPETASEEVAASYRDYLGQLRRLCAEGTVTALARGERKELSLARMTASFDLLVLSAPDLRLRNLLFRGDEDRITERAACSVLVVKTPRHRTHDALSDRPSVPEATRLEQFVAREALGTRIDVPGKAALFDYLSDRFSGVYGEVSVEMVRRAFMDRERAQNTAVGHAVALPHGTVEGVDRSTMGIFTLAEPIDYGAPDGEPVDVIFATVSPPAERETHLRLLSDLARLTRDTDILERLRRAEDPEEIERALGIRGQQVE